MLKVKISFFSIETYFSQFIDKFLKFEVMEYLIHCVLNRSSLISCKLLALYSTLKLRLGPKFLQFIHNSSIDSKLGFLSVSLRLYFQVFPSSQRDFWNFFMLLWLDFSVFPNSGKKRWKIASFFNISQGCTSKLFPKEFSNSLIH